MWASKHELTEEICRYSCVAAPAKLDAAVDDHGPLLVHQNLTVSMLQPFRTNYSVGSRKV